MTKSTTIGFPKANRPIQGVHESFIAFGQTSHGVLAVEGELMLGTTKVGFARTLQNPTLDDAFWVILFEKVPDTMHGQSYALEIREKGTLLGRCDGLIVSGGLRSIVVVYPTENDTVCPNFAAYGRTTEGGNVVGQLIKGGLTITGNTLQNGPVWVVKFTGVAQAVYDEFVAEINQSIDSSATNITVNNSAC